MTQFYTDAVTISDKFLDCKVNGLPIGVPFKSKIFIPTQKRCFFTEDVFTFILSPVFKPESTSTDQPSDLATAALKDNENNDDESLIEVKHEPFKSGDEIDEQIDCQTGSGTVSVLVKKEPEIPEVIPDETQNKKRQASDDSYGSGPTKHIKMKSIEDELQNEGHRKNRRSSRIKDLGYRPDYMAMEAGFAEYDSDNTTNQDNKECIVIKEEIKVEDNSSGKIEANEGNTEIKCCHHIDNKKETTLRPIQPARRDNDPDFSLPDDANLDEENHFNEESESEVEEIVDDSDDSVDDVEDKNKYKYKKLQVNLSKINLADHTDKYREEILQAYARKPQGKATEDVSMKLSTCTVCEKFKTEDLVVLENHIGQHIRGELNCDLCDFVGSYSHELCKHRDEEHRKSVQLCPVCGKGISSGTFGMKNHLGSVHDLPQWECSHCRKKGKPNVKFISNILFRKHIEMDHPETLQHCNDCKRKYLNDHDLQNHRKTGCQGTMPEQSYPCEKCGILFSSRMTVKRHIRRVHNKVRKHQCSHCPYATNSTTRFGRHLKKHNSAPLQSPGSSSHSPDSDNSCVEKEYSPSVDTDHGNLNTVTSSSASSQSIEMDADKEVEESESFHHVSGQEQEPLSDMSGVVSFDCNLVSQQGRDLLGSQYPSEIVPVMGENERQNIILEENLLTIRQSTENCQDQKHEKGKSDKLPELCVAKPITKATKETEESKDSVFGRLKKRQRKNVEDNPLDANVSDSDNSNIGKKKKGSKCWERKQKTAESEEKREDGKENGIKQRQKKKISVSESEKELGAQSLSPRYILRSPRERSHSKSRNLKLKSPLRRSTSSSTPGSRSRFRSRSISSVRKESSDEGSESDRSDVIPMPTCTQAPPDREGCKEIPAKDTVLQKSCFKNVHVEPYVPKRGGRNYSKTSVCYFCKAKLQSKMSKHYFAMHSNEASVFEIRKMRVRSKARKAALQKLINEGNFIHNVEVLQKGKGTLLVNRRPNIPSKAYEYLPCKYCKGFFHQKQWRQHVTTCCSRNVNTRENGKNLAHEAKCILAPFLKKEDEDMSNLNHVVQKIKETKDNPGLKKICEDDELIREFGLFLLGELGPPDEQRLKDQDTVRTKMSSLARLLMKLNSTTKAFSYSLSHYISPQYYKLVAKSVKELYITTGSSQLEINLGHYVKQASLLKASLAIQQGDAIIKQQANDFTEMYEATWNSQVSPVANHSKRLKAMNKPCELPTTEDLVVLKTFLDTEISHQIQKPMPTYTEYVYMTHLLLTSIVLFNRRRVNEVAKLKVTDYNKRLKGKELDTNTEIYNSLPASEKALLKRMELVEVRGKSTRGLRKVYIMLTNEMVSGLEHLLMVRAQAGVDPTNKYLFSRTTDSPQDGCEALRIVTSACPDLKYPDRVRSTKLRKYLATTTQMMDMRGDELQLIADHMSHSVAIHTEVYRLQSSVLERTKVARCLVALEDGNLQDFHGQSLSSMSLDELPYPQLEVEEMDEAPDEVAVESDAVSEIDEEQQSKPPQPHHPLQPNEISDRKKTRKQRWTPEEEKNLKSAFQQQLSCKQNVTSQDIRSAQSRFPTLKSRPEAVIRSKINNIILGKNKI